MRHAFLLSSRVHTRRAPFGVVFSDPQIATVGKRYSDLTLGSFVIGEVSFEGQGRSRVMLKNRELLHVYAKIKSGRLLGAQMFGPGAEHLGHLPAWVIQLGLTFEQILALPFYHPVAEEELRTALRDAAVKRALAIEDTLQYCLLKLVRPEPVEG